YNQIGFERDDLFQVRPQCISYFLLRLRRFREIAITRHASDAIFQSERKQDFSHVRGERDDSSRVRRDRNRASQAVGEAAAIARRAAFLSPPTAAGEEQERGQS